MINEVKSVLAAFIGVQKEANRKRYLLVFPAAVIGITVALIIITRRRK